jgi:hypothetical protein
MKNTLRCHGFGAKRNQPEHAAYTGQIITNQATGQNRASPQGVAAKIATSFVASLANIANIGCTSLRAIDDFCSQRTCLSSC